MSHGIPGWSGGAQGGTAAGRLQRGERAARQARVQGSAYQPVACPLQHGDHTVLPRAHLPGVTRTPAAVHAGPGACSRITGRARHPGRRPHTSPPIGIWNSARVWGGRGAPERPFWSSLRVVAGLASLVYDNPCSGGGRMGVAPCRRRWMVGYRSGSWHPATGLKPEEATRTPWVPWRSRTSVEAGGQALGQGRRTILPGMPPAAFALNAWAACASGYTAPTWGRRCPSSTRRASSIS